MTQAVRPKFIFLWIFSYHLTSSLVLHGRSLGSANPPRQLRSLLHYASTGALDLPVREKPHAYCCETAPSHMNHPDMSSLRLWVSMLTIVWAPVSSEMMEGLNLILLPNICLLVWKECKFVTLPWSKPLLHSLVLQCKDHSQPPRYLSSLLQWRDLTFLRHLAKRILYLFKRERWESGSDRLRSLSLVFSLKLMILDGTFLPFLKPQFLDMPSHDNLSI